MTKNKKAENKNTEILCSKSYYPTRVDPQNGKQLGIAGTTEILGT